MISSVKGIAFKFIKYNKFVIISSVFSIMISVSLIMNMFMFTSNAEISMKDGIKQLYGEMDMTVGFNAASNKKFDKHTIEKISLLKNIEEISYAIVGQLRIDSNKTFNVYSVGVDNSKLSKSRYKYVKDISEHEVVLNRGLAESMGVGEGDGIIINGSNFKIIEMFDDLKQSSEMPDVIFININSYKDILKNDIEVTYLMIKAFNKRNILEMSKDIQAIDKDFRIDIVEEDELIKANIDSLKKFMIFLSALVIIMCCLFILANFQTFLYNYRNQFALIRGIGGSTRQAFKIVFIQSTFINIIGVSLAIIVSYLSSTFLIHFLSSKFLVQITKIEFSFFVAAIIAVFSFIIIELFMLIPAINCSKILPLKIVEQNEKIEYDSKIGIAVGMLGIALSFGCFVLGIIYSKHNSIIYGIVSAVLLILSTYILLPYCVKNVLNMLLPVLKCIGGNGTFVAIKNLISQVRKSTLVITSLSTIIIITVFGGTFFNTLLKNDEIYLKSQFALDIVVTDRDTGVSNLGSSFKTSLDDLVGVRNISILSQNNILYMKKDNSLDYVEFCYASLSTLAQESIIPKLYGDLKSNVVITKDFAQKQRVKVGDYIELKKILNDGKGIDEIDIYSGLDKFRVETIIDNFSIRPGASIIFDWSNDKYLDEFTVFYKALIASNNIEATLQGLDNLRSQYPQIKWTTLAQALNESRQMLLQRWTLFIIVIITILVSLVFGILNTLINNILSKRKEYAILRTLKLDKKGLVKVILTQVLIYCLLGVILGCVLGTVISNIISLTESLKFSVSASKDDVVKIK